MRSASYNWRQSVASQPPLAGAEGVCLQTSARPFRYLSLLLLSLPSAHNTSLALRLSATRFVK